MIATMADLIAFLKRFHRPWLDDPSLDPRLISDDLPDGLAMLYRELGALAEIEAERPPFAAQDSLVPLSRLKRVDGTIEFAWENQGNWSARCSVGQSDPPVYSNAADIWTSERQGFVVVCDSLNHFLTTLSLQEAVMSCRNLIALRTDYPPDQVLRIPAQPLWLDGYYVTGEPDHHFFVSENQDVLVMDWDGIWLGSPFHDVSRLVAQGANFQVIY